MPSKKKKYNARFPAGRIKKIMQTDEEVGKVAQAVPIIISRTLELFVESLLTKSMQITQARNAKTLTPSHMKQCILSESRFDFLKDLVNNIPDASAQEDNENNAIFEANLDEDEKVNDFTESEEIQHMETSSSCNEQSTSSRTPVIQYGPKVTQNLAPKLNVTVSSLVKNDSEKSDVQITVGSAKTEPKEKSQTKLSPDNIPPLIPISHSYYSQNTSDTLCIDEDYDN